MLIVPMEEAQPGMKLVMTVTHPEQPTQELLKPGFVLDAVVIKRMNKLGVPTVYIDYPDLAELDKHLLPYLSPARQTIYNQIKNTIAAVQKTARPSVGFADYYAATRELILTLLQGGEHPLYLDMLSGSMGDGGVAHATAVAQLSITLGIRLQYYLIQQRPRLAAHHAAEVVNLGVAGMLHDLGKARLPPHLRDATQLNPPEDEADLREWRTHPQVGHDMLRHGVEASAVAAVLHHHQHFDGTGFPARPRGTDAPKPLSAGRIHVFARILRAADLYDRLTHAGPRRRASVQVLRLLESQYKDQLDPAVLAAMPFVIPPYPPGSRLQLSDGTRAVVTALNPKDPYHPRVRRTIADTWALEGDGVNLAAPDAPAITRLGDINVAKLAA